VEFLNGTNSLGLDANSPYRITVNNLAGGTYVLWAILTDNLGGQSSNSVTLIVNELPTVSITAPADDSGLLTPATFTLSANASDSDGSARAGAVLSRHYLAWGRDQQSLQRPGQKPFERQLRIFGGGDGQSWRHFIGPISFGGKKPGQR
jgi:hypothetical protein